MAATKYGHLFVSGLRPGQRQGPMGTIARFDDNIIKGSNFYSVVVWPTQPPEGPARFPGGHGPHTHQYPEILMHIGMNPDDPMDLGAEIEFYMGKEMEKHVFTQSTMVFIPAGMIHGPWVVKRSDRPWIMIEINQGPLHTEKSYKMLVPEELRETMLFIDDPGGEI